MEIYFTGNEPLSQLQNLRDNMDFFMDPAIRVWLFPDALVPTVLTATGDGEIVFDLAIMNTTIPDRPSRASQGRGLQSTCC